MKKLAIIAMVFAGSVFAADYSGIWAGSANKADAKYGVVPNTLQLTLNHAGTTVSGTLKLGNGQPIALSAGTVSGNQISFAVGAVGTGVLTDTGTRLQGRLTSTTGQVLDVVVTKQ